MNRSTPPPNSTNQHSVSSNDEEGPSAAMSATLMRHCHAAPAGPASKTHVVPPPLRHGVAGTSAADVQRGGCPLADRCACSGIGAARRSVVAFTPAADCVR